MMVEVARTNRSEGAVYNYHFGMNVDTGPGAVDAGRCEAAGHETRMMVEIGPQFMECQPRAEHLGWDVAVVGICGQYNQHLNVAGESLA